MSKLKHVIIIFLLITSCKSKITDKIKEEKIYSINIKEEDIKLNYKLSELIDTVTYIPLETNKESLIGRIDRIKFYNNYIYLYDRISNTIFQFYKNGKFISKYHRLGRGPFEYEKLQDFDIDTSGACYLLDNNKIIVLDSNFNGVKEIKLPFTTSRFAVFENVFAVTQVSPKQNEAFILSKRGETINSFFQYSGIPRFVGIKPFIKTVDKLLFIPSNADQVYSINSNSAILHAAVHFEKGVPDDFFTNQESKNSSITTRLIPDSYMHRIVGYCETPDFISFRFSYYYKGYDGPFFTLHSKNYDKTIIYTNEVINDCFPGKYPPLFLDVTETGEFIATIEASIFSEAIKGKDGILNFDDLRSISSMSNPVIALVKLNQLNNED
jgi:hypothetical protein